MSTGLRAQLVAVLAELLEVSPEAAQLELTTSVPVLDVRFAAAEFGFQVDVFTVDAGLVKYELRRDWTGEPSHKEGA